MMCIQHVYLIVTAKSTVEAYSGRDQQERETQHLNILYGFWSHHKEKRQVRQKWKDEFGGTSADERWRSGSKMEMWKREMGERWYEWIRQWSPLRPILAYKLIQGSPYRSSLGRWTSFFFESGIWAQRRVAKEAILAQRSRVDAI